jgi:hypothetical protein
MTAGASLVQDFWVGSQPRLRGRRCAPFEDAAVRMLFLLDRGGTLEDAAVAGFLESLGTRIDVAALVPRGQGGSDGTFGPEVRDDFAGLLEAAARRWPDGLPLLVAGHGVGGAVALSLADHPAACGTLALAPGLPRDALGESLSRVFDVPRHVAAAARPLLLVDARDDAQEDHAAIAALAASNPRAALLAVPGERRAPLGPPWAEAIAAWAEWAARAQ